MGQLCTAASANTGRPAHLIQLLQPKPLTLEELATNFDEGTPEETAHALRSVLEELVALNILEPE